MTPPLDRYDRQIDRAYRRWVATALAPALRPLAGHLPRLLAHPSHRRWRSFRALYGTPVFSSLPYLVGEGFPGVGRAQLHALGVAHVLLVFLALFDDRLNDGHVPFSRETNLLRRCIEAEAQARFAAAISARAEFWRHFQRAFDQHLAAHATEPALWSGAVHGYDHARFARDAAAKAALGRLSGLAVAILGEATASAVYRLARAVDHYMIGMQYDDDVTDWQDDFTSGRWTFFIVRHLSAREARRHAAIPIAELRTRVATATVAEEFLERGSRHYATCLARLDGFAMPTLRAWVEERRRSLQIQAGGIRHGRVQQRDRFVRALQQRWCA